ncbi:MAG TPA: outer-membrane lipoprotein carrier protein LolA [Pyrinomonadaceae bacterium]|nr:outer-membrane lipoprotein carrier protein LolA [Pyrinomonadaceae bacterium]
MKSIKFAIVFAVAFFIFAPSAANAQVIEVLKRMDAHYKALKSLKSGISREVFNSQLKETDNYSGDLVLVPGKGTKLSVLLKWTKPKEEVLSVVNGKYALYVPGIKRAYTGTSGDKRVKEKGGSALELMNLSKQEINSKYDAVQLGTASVGGTDTVGLRLTPKAKAEYKFIDVWVDGNGMPIQIKVTKNNNDTDTIRFSGIKKNENINGSVFKIDIPKGTEVVKG